MAVKRCEICGKDFETKGRGTVCDDCRYHTKCCICGRDVVFKGNQLTEYKRRGWITCSNKCGNEKRRRDAGVTNIAQIYSKKKERTCEVCGMTFQAKPNQMICDDCHHVECCICGKDMVLDAHRMKTYLDRGWITCSTKCGAQRAKITCQERYGVDNGAQTLSAREKVRDVRFNESVKTKHKRKMSLEKYFKDNNHGRNVSDGQRIAAGGELKWEAVARINREHPDWYAEQIAEYLGMTLTAVYNVMERNEHIPIPRHTRSAKEDCIAHLLDELGVTYIRHDKTQIKPLELDFYIPDAQVAIEVNDFWSHNSTVGAFGGSPKSPRYHWDKTVACSEKSIRLIHAWEHCLPTFDGESGNLGSWDVLKSLIIHAVKMTEHMVYARDTKVVEMKALDVRAFFESNNINGYRGANTAYCLVGKSVVNPTVDDVLMAYSVGRAHFGKGKYDAEIARGACRLGYCVVGGASKLWRYIIENTSYRSIVYYVDRNYYDASSMAFLDDVEYVGHSDSFWNYWPDESLLKNREPERDKEIRDGYRNGSIWQICNAGTDTYVWHRK